MEERSIQFWERVKDITSLSKEVIEYIKEITR